MMTQTQPRYSPVVVCCHILIVLEVLGDPIMLCSREHNLLLLVESYPSGTRIKLVDPSQLYTQTSCLGGDGVAEIGTPLPCQPLKAPPCQLRLCNSGIETHVIEFNLDIFCPSEVVLAIHYKFSELLLIFDMPVLNQYMKAMRNLRITTMFSIKNYTTISQVKSSGLLWDLCQEIQIL